MKICVLNGSPRGQYSVTLQTSLYLQKRYPQHNFNFVEVGARIGTLEKDLSGAVAGYAGGGANCVFLSGLYVHRP